MRIWRSGQHIFLFICVYIQCVPYVVNPNEKMVDMSFVPFETCGADGELSAGAGTDIFEHRLCVAFLLRSALPLSLPLPHTVL